MQNQAESQDSIYHDCNIIKSTKPCTEVVLSMQFFYKYVGDSC